MTLPSPVPRPTSGNPVPSSWRCINSGSSDLDSTLNADYEYQQQDCVITGWATTGNAVSVENTPLPVTGYTATSAPAPTPHEAGYTYEQANWSDIGPWFATFIFALILAPYAFMTLVKWVREAFGV